jgi:organic radical activating enzyme
MTKDQIDAEIDKLSNGNKDILIVFTGGEPTL